MPGNIDERRALAHLMDLLAVEGKSGREAKVAAAIRRKLLAAGCRKSWIAHDDVHRRITGDFQVGNLIVTLPGSERGPRRLFSGHMDTVPLCRGAVPVRKGNRIVSAGRTALGGDDRTGCACLVTMIETLLKRDLPRAPLTVLFTVGEEVGLQGARRVRMADLGRPKLGFNIDGGVPRCFVVGAVGAERWEAEVRGRSSHAGVHPERGISATLIASRAIADAAARGYFGKIVKGRRRGTSNVGRFQGGEANNQVTDLVRVTGESRSHDPRFLSAITTAYRRAFERAAHSVRDERGRTGRVRFTARRDYAAFRLDPDAPVVAEARSAARALRLRSKLLVVDGGLDANWLNARGLPTVTFGAGQHNAHTVEEYVDVREYLGGCRLAVALAAPSTHSHR
ncbi:MAG: M20/M25/M40 family metallo-hydrolase [Planctomycetota bacterium]|jgi:tripeptide aminopeptidase